MFDAVILADSPHADAVILGLTLAERARRVAVRAGARRVYVVASDTHLPNLARWDAERGDAALLVIRGGDQLVHLPLVRPLLAGHAAARVAVGPDGELAGALYVRGPTAADVVAAIGRGEQDLVALVPGAERIAHGDIARHPATTKAERKAAARMLLRILVKQDEDSPVSKYVYRPLSRPITRLLVGSPVTPNQVSYVVGLIGLIGCWFTAQPTKHALILGAGLVLVAGILDGCDGELSRLRLTSSAYGAWLDTVVDEVTSVVYFFAIGYHTYLHHPQPWLASTIVLGGACYVASIYGIYYFCIVVLKAGGSQYYVGNLEVVETDAGVGLRPRPRAPSTLPRWMQHVGTWLLYVIRRDFINLAAFFITLVNGYAVIYGVICAGAIVAGLIVTREHVRLRSQLREVARRGGMPRLLQS